MAGMGFSNDGIYRIFGVSLHSINVDLPQQQKMLELVSLAYIYNIYNIFKYISSNFSLMSFQYIPCYHWLKLGLYVHRIHIGFGQLIDWTGVLLLVVT